MKLVLRASADADLRSIGQYTIETWGEEQAESYVSDLLDYLEALASGERRQREHVSRTGRVFLKSKFRADFVYAQKSRDTLRIVRILHERRSTPRHVA